MGVVSTISSFFLGGNSGFFVLCVVPVLMLVGILWVCKTYNFSLMPDGLQGRTPPKFKLPKLSREKSGRMYKWNVEDDGDDDPYGWDSDDDESDDEDDGEYEEYASVRTSAMGSSNLYD